MLGLAFMLILSISLIGASDVPSDDDVGRVSFSEQVAVDVALVDADLQAIKYTAQDYCYKTEFRKMTAISYLSDQTDFRKSKPNPIPIVRKARDGLSYGSNYGLLATSRNFWKPDKEANLYSSTTKYRRARDGIISESEKLASLQTTFALG
jgi:hypothetical protein